MKWFGLFLLVALAGFFIFRPQPPVTNEEAVSDSPQNSGVGEDDGPRVRYIEQNPFVEEYGVPDRDTVNDLNVVELLLQNSQLIIKDFDTYFLPENRQIVGFLQGKNRDRLAWIPKKHQFVNEEGELVDRWGTPIFFHRESGFQFELRSAGPDRRHWTDDDISTKTKATN